MNKCTILTLVCFSILPCFTSAAETYEEYVHITSDNDTLELAEGEAAEVVYSNGIHGLVGTINGKSFDLYSYHGHSQYATGISYFKSIFAGPMTLKASNWSEQSLVTLKVTRIAETTASNSDSTTTPDPETTDYLSMDGWLFFTEFPWVYSSRNDSWYYLTAADDKLFAFNENIGGTNWMMLNNDN